MKQRLSIRFVLTLMVIVACCLQQHAAAQFPGQLSIQVYRMPQTDGSVHFELNVINSLFREVHLPDGTTTSGSPAFDGLFADRTFNSFGDLKSAIVGTWTIEHMAGGGLPHEEYTFVLSDFPESIADTPPLITYPSDGSRVPPEFTMTWEWPASETPENWTTLIRRLGPGNRRSQFGSGGTSPTELSQDVSAIQSTGQAAERLSLWVGGYSSSGLASYLSDVTPQQSMPRFSYEIQSVFLSLSTPVNVRVGVPECNGIVLVVMSMSCTLLSNYRYARMKRTINQ
jgi:hypothetical protein